MDIKEIIEDKIEQGCTKGFSATKFLTPKKFQQAMQVIDLKKQDQLSVLTLGGYSNSERKRIIMIKAGQEFLEESKYIKAYVIKHRKQDEIGHRDILGALMNLGLERNTIGDIEAKDDKLTFVAISEVGDFIKENFTKAGNKGIKVLEIPFSELGERRQVLLEERIIVPSMRIDVFIAEVFKLSRSQASSMIKESKVTVNYEEAAKQDANLVIGDIVALRGKGKVKLTADLGMTKKNRFKLLVGIYT